MALILLIFILFFVTSATSGVHNPNHAATFSVDSRSFYTPTTDIPAERHSDLSTLPVDSRTFYDRTIDTTKPSGLNAFPVDSRTFYDRTIDATKLSGLNAFPVDSRTFYDRTIDTTKLSGLNTFPVDSRTFYDRTIDTTKPSSRTVVPVNSQSFYARSTDTSNPSSILADDQSIYASTKDVPTLSSSLNSLPVDSRTFYVPSQDMGKPSARTSIRVDSHNFYATIPVDSRGFYTTTKYPDDVSYCSVYFKKEELKQGTMLCPLFTSPSPQEDDFKDILSSICERKSSDGETMLKFCTSSYKDMVKEVTTKLGKNKVLFSDKVHMASSIIVGFEHIADYGKAVICHRAQISPHLSFFCHQISRSSVYALSLNASSALAHHQRSAAATMLAVCHDDTSHWEPNRLAFKLLKVKPGAKICHLLPPWDLAWISLE